MNEAPAVRLGVIAVDGTTREVALRASGPLVIGRDPGCDVVLPSSEVSRRHATLEWIGGAVRLTDISANGTFVGEQFLQRASIAWDGVTPVLVGPFRLVLVGPGATPGLPAGPADRAPAAAVAPGVPGAPAGPLAPAAHARPVAPAAHAGLAAPPGPVAPAAAPTVRAPDERPRGRGPAAAATTAAVPIVRDEPSPSVLATAVRPPLEVPVELRRRLHRLLLDNLDLAALDRRTMDDRAMRPKVLDALRRICAQIDLPPRTDVERLIVEMADETLGLGPLEQLLADPTVDEIMVVDPATIYVERRGKIEETDLRFTDDESVRAVIERIVTPLGRRIDESAPVVDARLKDGSRVNAIIRPLALRGACITIRKFARTPLGLEDLVRLGAVTERIGRFLTRAVVVRRNIVISGGTSSGKTTFLNVLSAAIPGAERIVTIEDSAELHLAQRHVVSLETRPPNMEGKGEITVRDLVRNALRMRPDRIIVGECRGGEALDMLQAMNTGHEGSMTTLHANSPREALSRLETMALMAGVDLPGRALREQIASSLHLVVQLTRLPDGARRVTSVSEVAGLGAAGEMELRELFTYHRTGTGPRGESLGEYRATGYLPSFLELFLKAGLVTDGEYL